MAETAFELSLSDTKPMLVPLALKLGTEREFKHSDGSAYAALLKHSITRGQALEF